MKHEPKTDILGFNQSDIASPDEQIEIRHAILSVIVCPTSVPHALMRCKCSTTVPKTTMSTRNKSKTIKAHTFLHNKPQWSLIGPSIPHATPLNHQKLATITKATTPNATRFVRSFHRAEKIQ